MTIRAKQQRKQRARLKRMRLSHGVAALMTLAIRVAVADAISVTLPSGDEGTAATVSEAIGGAGA